jgi:hypothetical protein
VTGTAVGAPAAAETGNDASARAAESFAASRPRPNFVGWLRRPVVAGLLLFLMYAGVSCALNDPRGSLGTDTGGKLATLRMMERHGGLDPDVGYWAVDRDPTGVLHPLFYTYRAGDKWVNVTTLPMLYAAYPLYRLGGDRLVLLLPMLGAVACAFAARALARRLGAVTGWPAFWIIGVASPVAIYALDFWEHSWGLALMLWAAVFLLDVAEARAGWRAALAGGALFGAAATMRTEALVYLFVAAAVACLTIAARERALRTAITRGLAIVAGAVTVLASNQLLERLTIGAPMRASRAAGTAAEAGSSAIERGKETLTYVLGMNLVGGAADWIAGLIVVSLIGFGAWALHNRPRDRARLGMAALVVAGVVFLMRFADGLGFVPGLLTAAPLAVVGLLFGWRRSSRFPFLVACVALPLVWAFQYSGGAGPQWGSRYELLSGALLAVIGIVALRSDPRALAAVVIMAGLVTAGGLAWLSVRSHTVGEAMTTITARHDEAIISRDAHALREGGAFYESGRHWLTATSQHDFERAVAIVREAGDTEFALIASDPTAVPADIAGYVRGSTQMVALLRPDVRLMVVTYRLGS